MQKVSIKLKSYIFKLYEGISWFINVIRRFEVLVTVINIGVVLWIVPAQAEATRAHQLVVLDYRGIRAALTPLRINDEYTYDLCVRKHDDINNKRDISYFKEDVNNLRTERMLLMANLISATMGMNETFDQKSYKEIEWFIKWNNTLNLSYDKVCDKKLIDGDKLLDWEKTVLREMRKAL